MNIKPIILIPARLSATRFPNKPLAKINHTEMIIHVLKRAEETGIKDIYVACADQEIKECVETYGGKAVLTDPNHESGSDRIFEALQIIDPEKHFNVIINLQGDLPTFDPSLIQKLMDGLTRNDIATLAAVITDPDEKDNPNVVKAIFSPENNDLKKGKALYFTRSSAPYGTGDLYHHIGIYGYKREALETFVKTAPSYLEKREKLEQLRALEHNLTIHVTVVDTIPLGVDTPEDLIKAEIILKKETDESF